MAKSNSRLAQIVGGHLDVDLVAHANPDEVFSHLARDMRENLVAIGQGHSEHCAREDLGHRAS